MAIRLALEEVEGVNGVILTEFCGTVGATECAALPLSLRHTWRL